MGQEILLVVAAIVCFYFKKGETNWQAKEDVFYLQRRTRALNQNPLTANGRLLTEIGG